MKQIGYNNHNTKQTYVLQEYRNVLTVH